LRRPARSRCAIAYDRDVIVAKSVPGGSRFIYRTVIRAATKP
jgi:hypothetical protein